MATNQYQKASYFRKDGSPRQHPFIILDSDKVVRFDDIINEFETKQKLINHLKKKVKVLGAIHSNGKIQSKRNGWKYL